MGAATAEVEGASAAAVGVDSTGSVVGGATAAELSSARSSASVEADTGTEVAAAGANASAELGGSAGRSESGSEPPQPAAASAAAVPAAARTHRRHRRKRSRRMHDNKSMVHLSVGTERRSSGVRTGRDGEDEGKGNRRCWPEGAEIRREAQLEAAAWNRSEELGPWLESHLTRPGRRWQGVSRNFFAGGQSGFCRERFWKLANRGTKPNWTRPVGPLRCLATEISARPAVSVLEGL